MAAFPQPKVIALVALIALLSLLCGLLIGRSLPTPHPSSSHSSHPTATALSSHQVDRLNHLESLILAQEHSLKSPKQSRFLPHPPAPAPSTTCPRPPPPSPIPTGAALQDALAFSEADHSGDDFSHLTFWSTDFHISPIADLKYLFTQLGIRIIDKSLSGACGSRGTCAQDLKVLNGGNAYEVGAHPEVLSKQLFEAYQNDDEFRSVDGFICFHPTATCQLYAPFNKSLLMISSTRYEHGQRDPSNWKRFNRFLQLASRNPRHLLAGNSVYDADYVSNFIGAPVKYIPSFCGYITARYGLEGQKRRTEFLLGHSHVSASKDQFWDQGTIIWKEMRQWVEEAKERSTDERVKAVELKGIGEVYPGRYEYQDLANHPCIVHMPYQVSVMSMFEQYRMGLPLVFPSLAFLVKLQVDYAPLSERTWARVHGRGAVSGSDIPGHPTVWWPDPNNDVEPQAIQYWLAKSDYYVMPHVLYYDDWDDLVRLLATTDFDAVSARMKKHSEEMEKKLVRQWKGILTEMFRHRPKKGYEMPVSYEKAMKELWGMDIDHSTGFIKDSWADRPKD